MELSFAGDRFADGPQYLMLISTCQGDQGQVQRRPESGESKMYLEKVIIKSTKSEKRASGISNFRNVSKKA